MIKNTKDIATSRERKLIIDVLENILKDCEPQAMIRRNVRKIKDGIDVLGNQINFGDSDLYVVGAGRAAGHMAEALHPIIGDYVTKGYINTDSGHEDIGNLRIQKSSPHPAKQNMTNTSRILSLAKKAKEDDVVLVLLSEGASSMLTYPSGEITPDELLEAEKTIFSSGISEDEATPIMSHISAVKGGQLAKAFGCRIYTLVISEKMMGDLSAVGGSPCDWDLSTFEDAHSAVKKHKIKLPKGITRHLDQGKKGKIEETPKIMPSNSRILVVGSVFDILASAKEHCASRKIRAKEIMLDGESDDISEEFCKTLSSEKERPCIYIGYGDTAAKTEGNEFIAGCLNHASNIRRPWALMTFSTGASSKCGEGLMVDGSQYEKLTTSDDGSAPSKELLLKRLEAEGVTIESEETPLDLSSIHIAFLGTSWNSGKKNNRRNSKKGSGKNHKKTKR